MKRAFDVAAAGLGLIFLWPVILVLAVLIRWGSHGPAIFAQSRVGRNGRIFHSAFTWARRSLTRRADSLSDS